MSALRENPGYPDDFQHRLAGMQMQPSVQRMPATNPGQIFFHFDILRSLQMHRKMAAAIGLVFLLLSGAYMAKRWNNYKASAIVYVQPAPPRLMANGPAQQWPYDANTYESYIQQQIHDVTRPDVLIAAVKRIPGFQGSNESDQAAADHLNGNLKVTRVGNGYQISIEAAATDPDQAALMANAVAGSYIQSATRELRAGDPQRIQLLNDERDRITKELASDRAEQEGLNRKLGVAGVGAATPDPYDDQIAAVRAELVRARTANDEAAANLMAKTGSGQNSAALDAQADELVASDPGLVSMKTALNKRRSELISQMANLTPNHPEYKQDAEELAQINTKLDDMSKELRAKAGAEITQRLKSDLERTSSVEGRLNAQLAQMTATAGSATPRLQRESDLAADIGRLQNRFAVVDEQYRNLTMENNAPGAVYLSASALPPLRAARNMVMRNGLVVLIAGLVFALGAALIAHNLDPKIYIAADVERVLGFAPMALLPDFYEVGTGVAEEYMLRLAAAVEHAHQQDVLNSCIFTGVAPGAGVSTVSTRVTNMLQAMGRATVLVDAAGTPPPPRPLETLNPGHELIHSPRGSRSTALLQQMTQEAGEDTIVVTDTAPLLVSGETEYLARFVDSAIIVIESGVTTKVQLRDVARTLQRLEVSAVGFVLNRISVQNANPAFRHSVRAVERHIRTQARAFDRAAARSEMPSRGKSRPGSEGEHGKEPARRSPETDRHWSAVSEPAAESAPQQARQAAYQEERPESFQESTWPVSARRRASFVDPEPPFSVAAVQAAAVSSEPERDSVNGAPFHGYAETAQPSFTPSRFDEGPEPAAWTSAFVSESSVEPQTLVSEPRAAAPSPVQEAIPARAPGPGYEELYGEFLRQVPQPWNVQPADPARSEAVVANKNADQGGLPDSLRKAPQPIEEPGCAAFLRAPSEQNAPEQFAVPGQDRGLPTWLREPAEPVSAPVSEPVQSPTIASEATWPLASPAVNEEHPLRAETRMPPVAPRPARGREGVHMMPPAERKPASMPTSADDVAAAMWETFRAEATPHRDLQIVPPTDHRDQRFEISPEFARETQATQQYWSPGEDVRAAMHQGTWPPAEPDRAPSAHVAPSIYSNFAEPQRADRAGTPEPVSTQPASGTADQEQDFGELPFSAASRLGGLRNLLVSLGIQNLHKETEQRKVDAKAENRLAERPVYAVTDAPAENEPPAGPLAAVIARPEIIPPRFSEMLGRDLAVRDKEPPRPVKSPQVNRWDSPEDVDTLPSRRGQYRKRH